MAITKDDIQNIVLENSDKKAIVLEHCTGLGKSFSALKIIHKYKPKKVLLLVAEIHHKLNWSNEILKFQNLYNIDIYKDSNITMECYASMKNYTETEWDFIICDEAHHLSDLRIDFLTSMVASKYILLSATLEPSHLQYLLHRLHIYNKNKDYYYSKISLKYAINKGIIPEPDIYIIPIQLNDKIYSETIEETWGKESLRKTITTTYATMWDYLKNKKIYPNTKLIIRCTQAQKNEYYVSKIEYWRERFFNTYQDWVKNKWLQYGSQRKRFLGELKTPLVHKLLTILDDTRYICYCTSIDQANKLGADAAVHSKNKSNGKILQEFQDKKRNHLFCIGMLTEGQNLKDIEVGIIVQLDGKERPFVQKMGRILRSETPQQYIFYYKNTRDEEYLSNILKGVDMDYIQTIDNIEELNYESNN